MRRCNFVSVDTLHFYLQLLAIGVALASPFRASAQIEPTGPITFEAAYRLAVERSPQSQLLQANLEATDGHIEQALLRPNPTVGADVENVLGTGDFKGFDRSELTLSLSQLIESRRKRQARADVAVSRKQRLKQTYEAELAALRYAVRQAYSSALVAQEAVSLQSELLAIAEASENEASRRAEAATASSIELAQARLATRRQAFDLKHAKRMLRQAKANLAALWNEPQFTDFELAGKLALESDIPRFEQLEPLLDNAPAIARYESEAKAREAIVAREQAEAKGDFELFAGAKYVREGSDDAAIVFGVDIPWKIRDRNQGNIRAARAELRAAQAERALARREAVIQLAASYQEMVDAQSEWVALQDELLPAAESALEATQTGYEQGATTLLNVLEARRALFEIRSEMLAALERYLTHQANIERLTASPDTL